MAGDVVNCTENVQFPVKDFLQKISILVDLRTRRVELAGIVEHEVPGIPILVEGLVVCRLVRECIDILHRNGIRNLLVIFWPHLEILLKQAWEARANTY